jgi:DNA-binding CsgD family transcriptional regulator
MVSPGRDELLGDALAGRAAVRISRLEDSEDADLRLAYGRAVEAYIPLVLNARVVGAYEFDADLSSIESIRPLVWASLAATELSVFVSLLLVVVGTWEGRPRPLSHSRAAGPRQYRDPPLTRREFEVLRLMADGLTYAQIAEVLIVDEETVRSHAKGVLRKLGQPDRAAAVVAGRRAGLLDGVPGANVQRSPGEDAGGTHLAWATRPAKPPRPWLAADAATDAWASD